SVTATTAAFPTVSITSPATGSTAQIGTITNVAITAADSDGTVLKVDLLDVDTSFGNTPVLVGSDATAPYSIAFLPQTQGIHVLYAQATDNVGNVTRSAPVVIAVASLGSPAVNCVSPNS